MPHPISSWLSGGDPSGTTPDSTYPGETLGLPEQGSQSLAGSGRRFVALLIDWFIAYGLAALMMGLGLYSQAWLSTSVLLVWFVIGAVSVRLFGFTPGQLVMGLMVVPVDNRIHVGFGRALARGLLLAFVIPALFMDCLLYTSDAADEL